MDSVRGTVTDANLASDFARFSLDPASYYCMVGGTEIQHIEFVCPMKFKMWTSSYSN
jgi:hypothetical protein